jgi:anaerobic magnesium-protoporphyrin IX monomethyl ester cyclase
MKVLLANPPWVRDDRVGFRSNVRWPFTVSRADFERGGKVSYHFPIYQAYTLAVLQQDEFDVAAIDCSISQMNVKEFVGAVAAHAPDLVVLEVATPSFRLDMRTSQALKESLDLPTAVIGTHASVFHRAIVNDYPAIDFVIRGEYEYTVLELARALRDRRDPGEIEGLTFRHDGTVVVTQDRPYIADLDRLPFPARDYFDWGRYHEPTYYALPWITMISSRGCPYRCTFCSWPQTMYGHKYRVRSAKNVVDEMEHCVKKYRPGEIFFDDDTFTIGKSRVMDICREIRDRNLQVVWSCMGRTDTVDPEMLAEMFSAGCRKIKFGVETGSEKMMETIQKGLDLSRVGEIFESARSVGMEVHGTFMIGLPGETRETVKETVTLASSIPMDSVQFSIATPFPGTRFYAECVQNGWLVTENWDDYDGNFGSVVSYPQLSKVEIEELLYFAYREYDTRRKRDPLAVRFKREARRTGLRGALRRATESVAIRISRKTEESLHAVADRRSVAIGWDWYPYDADEGGRPIGAHSSMRVLTQSPNRKLRIVARTPHGVQSSELSIFSGDALLTSMDIGGSWQEFVLDLPGHEPTELTLEAHPTIPRRKNGYIRHYGAIIKNIAATSG